MWFNKVDTLADSWGVSTQHSVWIAAQMPPCKAIIMSKAFPFWRTAFLSQTFVAPGRCYWNGIFPAKDPYDKSPWGLVQLAKIHLEPRLFDLPPCTFQRVETREYILNLSQANLLGHRMWRNKKPHLVSTWGLSAMFIRKNASLERTAYPPPPPPQCVRPAETPGS